jgi:CRISPR-associated protein Cas2
MTVVVTSDVPDRFRGFLASCMLELAPGVYTSPRMNEAVRIRVWSVVTKWWEHHRRGHVVMTWPDPSRVGGQAIAVLGVPDRILVELDGVFLSRRDTRSVGL